MSAKIEISQHTIDVLKSFTHINNSIRIAKGNRIRVMNVAETVFGDVTVPEEFPADVNVVDMGKMLAVFNLPGLKKAEQKFIDFQESHMVISGGRTRVKYRYTERSFVTPADMEFELENDDLTIELDWDTLNDFIRSCSQLQLTLVEVGASNGRAFIRGLNPELGDESNDYEMDLGETEYEDCTFGVMRSYMNFKSGNYKLQIDGDGIAEFVDNDQQLKYHIGVELTV